MVIGPLFSIQFSYTTSNDYPENLGHIQITGNIFRIYNQSYCVWIIQDIMLCQYIISHEHDIYLPYPAVLSTLKSALCEDLDFLGKSWESRMRLHIYICEYMRILQLPTRCARLSWGLCDSSEGDRSKVTLQPAVLEHVLEDTSHIRGHAMACVHS